MGFDTIWFARDGASILRQNGSAEHADAVVAVCDRIVAAQATAVRYREALDKINRAVRHLDVCATDSLRELGLNLRLVCQTALAGTSDQHRKWVVAAGLRELAKEVPYHADWLNSEADRLEKEARG